MDPVDLTHMLGFIAIVVAPSAAALGLAPRIGPLRAVVLGLSTRFRPTQCVSQLTSEVHTLRGMLATAHEDQYVVVSGPKGIGKTCMVDTALQCTPGVVSVHVAAGTSEKEILAAAFKAITRRSIKSADHSNSAQRVLWWHHFIFRQPATVVLRAAERKPTQQFADLDSSARALTHDYGARVIIDASNNSLPEAATATKREKVLALEPMQRTQLESIPELQPLHDMLRRASLADTAWLWTGGNPADYRKLWGSWEEQLAKSAELRLTFEQVVLFFVQSLRCQAKENVVNALTLNQRLRGLYEKFRNSSELPGETLSEMGIVRASPDKVLRLVRRSTINSLGIPEVESILVPADAATAALLLELK